ncbi:ParA family protein [Enterovirga rhinocerotis]|uniref:Chromosome partitioning protein n=1 Tax=Enterovirga rhinocerotis TaxID=1339210 RepID=A0A4R7C5H3_9HYPH|nr:ParA family protein [Enterovirga rhinocerotis]TDR93628.1 chromosome partitioning protein [Enterovirga rhinocerotis]
MTTILVATVKGGSGKTTISTNLAAALASSGESVLLADLDRQRSSTEWLGRRPADAAPIQGAEWMKELGRPPADVAFTIIDAPAALKTKQIEDVVAMADHIIVPVVPSIIDEAATLRFLAKLDDIGSVSKGRKAVGLVGNRMRAGTRSSDRLAEFMTKTGHRPIARIRDAQAYLDVVEAGLGIFDRPGSRYATLKEDWWPLLEFARYG